jgi:hypothetical protein
MDPRTDLHPEQSPLLVPAEGCLARPGRWILAVAPAAARRCVPVMAGAPASGPSVTDLGPRLMRHLDRLEASGTVKEIVLGADVDPLLAPAPVSAALLAAAESIVARGIGLRVCTRGAPEAGGPWARLLMAAAEAGGATLEVALISTDAAISALYEPGAPPPAKRLAAARALAATGVRVEGRLGPLLPWIADTAAHLEEAVHAFHVAGIRRLAATYLQLDADGMRRLRRLPPAHRALLRGCLRSAPRHAGEAHLLPRDLRAQGHARLARIAARFGMIVLACAEANPDLGVAAPCQTADAPRSARSGPARRLGTAQRTGRDDASRPTRLQATRRLPTPSPRPEPARGGQLTLF